jgi:Rad3-related DNA helicase
MISTNVTQKSAYRQLSIPDILGPEGLLAQHLPGYEERPGQLELADHTAQAMTDGESLIAEAATGIGKSLGYLVPALLAGEKIIVSTATVVLQAQLQEKDLPLLKHAFPRLTWATIKGRHRYVCKREIQKTDRALQDGLFGLESQASVEAWNAVQAWTMDESRNGRLADLDTFPGALTDDVRDAITVDSDRCTGKVCAFYESCFAEQAKRRAKNADVIVVNHHILLLDLMLRQHGTSLLPNRQTIIIDEAHTLEAVASDVSATHVGYARWRWLQARLTTMAESTTLRLNAMPTPAIDTVEGLLRQIDGHDPQVLSDLIAEALSAGARALSEAQLKFDRWATQFGEESKVAVPDDAPHLVSATQAWETALLTVVTHLEQLKIDDNDVSDPDDPDDEAPAEEAEEDSSVALHDWAKLAEMVQRLRTDLQLCLHDAPNYVRYLEAHARRGFTWATLTRSMIHVGTWLQTCLWHQFATISVSATLTTYEPGHGASFAYWMDRVGHPEAETLIIESPFNFRRNCLLYTPANSATFEPPKRERAEAPQRYQQRIEAYHERLAQEILQLLTASQGRALVLYTSSAVMRAIAERVRPHLPWRLLVQGDLQRLPLLDTFRTECSSVLFATRSFWQGVDISGESLSLLIIDKLPFDVPSDPLARARVEDVKRRFGSGADWGHLTLPAMLTLLRQGVGRLIRRMDDRGVIALLDGRVKSKSYGTAALKSLPPARHTSDLAEMQRFFAEGGV